MKKAILILGMHRSGTSALAGALNHLGVFTGKKLIPADHGNTKGYFESIAFYELNEKILKAMGSGWDDALFLRRPFTSEEIDAFALEAQEVIRQEFDGHNIVALKDPRDCLLFPIYEKAFTALGYETVVVIPLRHPSEVASSLGTRNGFSIEKGVILWCLHFLLAERTSRGHRRIFHHYDDVLNRLPWLIQEMEEKLDIKLPLSYEEARENLDSFITRELRHHKGNALSNAAIPSLVTGLIEHIFKNDLNAGGHEAFFDSEARTFTDFYRMLYNDDIVNALNQGKHDSARLAELEPQYNISLQRIGDLEGLVAGLNSTVEGLNSAIEGLNSAIEGLKTKVSGLEGEIAHKDGAIASLSQESQNANNQLAHIYASHGWKALAAYYRFRDALLPANSLRRKAAKAVLKPAKITKKVGKHVNLLNLRKIILHYRTFGLKQTLRKINNKLNATPAAQEQVQYSYTDWVRMYDTLSDKDRFLIKKRISKMRYKPVFSVIMPVYNTDEKWLRKAIESFRNQLYPHAELCIADDCSPKPHVRQILREYEEKDSRIKVVYREQNGHISKASNSALELATGEFVAMFDHDDELTEHALYLIAERLNENPELDFIYTDQDMIDVEGTRSNPYFKPEFNPDLLRSQNFVDHLAVFRRSIVKALGGWRSEFDGSQDYDMVLRFIEKTTPERISHVPFITYHWRSVPGSIASHVGEKNYAPTRSRQALKEHLERIGVKATVTSHYPDYSIHRVIYPLPEQPPLVSVIVPTKDGLDILSTCMDGLLKKTDYKNIEVIIVDNQSEQPETLKYLEDIAKDPRVRVINYDKPFNYSTINNVAAAQAKGTVLALLNNDIEVINPDWLTEMVSHALRPEIGAVGARLFYPDDTVQHAGVFLGLRGRAGHLYRYFQKYDMGHWARAVIIQNLSAVTAACMVLRREVFDEVDGFDEENFSVTFNDVDLCLRILEKGYRNLYTPHAELYHHESKTRGMLAHQTEEDYFSELWSDIIWNDPAYNPNLTIEREDISPAFPPRVCHPWQAFKFSSKTPLVSIITRTHGQRQEFLREALQSIFNQTYRPIQVVVVEDGSNNAEDMLKSLTVPEGITLDYEPLSKQGRCAAGNRGMELARGEAMCFLDDDDLLLPEHLSVLVKCLARNCHASGSYALSMEVPTEVKSLSPLKYREGERKTTGAPFSLNSLWNYNYIPIQAILFRREMFERYGGLDPMLDCLEDWDLWLRFTAESDFAFANQTTSLFRMPMDQSILMQRRQEHLNYLPTLRGKQKALLQKYKDTPYAQRLRSAFDSIL